MVTFQEMIVRILIAVFIGMIIGAEREYKNKDAGLRTLTLICIGSCIFTLVSIIISPQTPDRIASNIVTGIGFLGGGVIFKSDNGVNGLTTAATIWVTAALGMTVASGYLWIAAIGTLIVLGVLFLLPVLENFIDKINEIRTYTIVCLYEPETLKKYESLMKQYQLHFRPLKQTKVNDEIIGSWSVQGRGNNHDRFIDEILRDKSVKKFDF